MTLARDLLFLRLSFCLFFFLVTVICQNLVQVLAAKLAERCDAQLFVFDEFCFDSLLPCRYIKLYGMKFSKEDHIKFVKLLLELISIPNLEPDKVNKFCYAITSLLR